jgi:hypothetical protein
MTPKKNDKDESFFGRNTQEDYEWMSMIKGEENSVI